MGTKNEKQPPSMCYDGENPYKAIIRRSSSSDEGRDTTVHSAPGGDNRLGHNLGHDCNWRRPQRIE